MEAQLTASDDGEEFAASRDASKTKSRTGTKELKIPSKRATTCGALAVAAAADGAGAVERGETDSGATSKLEFLSKGASVWASQYVKEGISESQVIEIKSCFDLLDLDGQGELDLEETIDMLESMQGDGLDHEPLMVAMHGCRRRMVSDVTFAMFFDQLQPLMTSSDQSQDSIRRAWRLLDEGCKGSLTAEDLVHAARTYESDITAEELNDMMAFADTEGNGEITFDEFYSVLTYRGGR